MSARPSRWSDLLALALPALDHVFGERGNVEHPPWTLGGGTALAIRLDHRVSFDIDIFVPGTRLELFTPWRNAAARRISDRFQWPGHDLKFERPEGEIDFLAAMLQTEPGFEWLPIDGRQIAVETVEEVIVKKLRYRSASLKARDIFDMAAAGAVNHELGHRLARYVPDTLGRVRESIEISARQGVDRLRAAIDPTERGSALLPEVFDVALSLLDEAQRLATGPDPFGPARPERLR